MGTKPNNLIALSEQPQILTRVRVTFSKSGSLIYTGALDIHKIWERVIRRADLNLAYTQGFNPGPRINLASALPLGITGEQEMVDFWFYETPDLTTFSEKVNNAAPPGLRALKAELIPLSEPALQTRVESAVYRVGLFPAEEFSLLVQSVRNLLQKDSLPRERRGKPYDLRPLILELTPSPNDDGSGYLEMYLQAREGATGRADEVMAALGLDAATKSISRVHVSLKN